MRFVIAGIGLALALATVGCFNPYGILGPARPCTLIYVYGLNVQVSDGVTGQPVTTATVTATALATSPGAFPAPEPGTTEVLTGSDGSYFGAGEAPGTYLVTVTAPGFAPVPPQTVMLGFDGCHVIPQTLNFVLVPQ